MSKTSERRYELDIIKFLAILFMVVVHIYEETELGSTSASAASYVVEFVGSPLAAPVFMFCMGIGLVYSRHSDARFLARRGVKLLLIGYGLNLYRGLAMGIEMAGYTGSWTAIPMMSVMYLTVVDILQFAGLAFLFFALMKKWKLKSCWILLVSIVMLFAAQLIPQVDKEQYLAASLLGIFRYQSEMSSFPFLQWLLFPVLGMIFGENLRKAEDVNRFYLAGGGIGTALFAGTTLTAVLSGKNVVNFFMDNYYNMDALQILWTISIVLMWISLWYFISMVFHPEKLKTFISYCSRNLNKIYIIHWLIVIWVYMLDITAYWQLLVVSALVFSITVLLLILFQKFRLKKDYIILEQ